MNNIVHSIILLHSDGIEILSVDQQVSEIYADIKIQLKKDGYTIPENDIWIAAIAQKNNLAVATCDKHFYHIKSIKVIGLD
ncbi:MAG: PIN domain-containing protein [Clostridiales Family XIII bacterium]|nr:PIN domain-containing protein [Clostridiales Family XIII bacterium]